MDSKDTMLLKTIDKFFNNQANFNLFSDILNKNSKISLRLIDWFVTNYCKKFNVVYQLKKNNKMEFFNVHFDYKNQLKAYQKKRFDPFKRKNKTGDNIINYNGVTTTIGQLNFFKWAIKKQILEYIKNHINLIENDMNECNDLRKSIKNVKRKKNMSISATRTITQHHVEHIVTFD